VAIASAWYKWGWDGFGWVSREQLHESLDAVKHALGEKIAALRDEVMHRFTQVEEAIRQSVVRLERVDAGVASLRDDVAKGNATMASLERRLGSLESNTERSAQGVELLVHLVHSSALVHTADEQTMRGLEQFTGRELPAPRVVPPLPAPMEPQRSASSSFVVQALTMPLVTTP